MRLALLFSGQGNQQTEHWVRLLQTILDTERTALRASIPETYATSLPRVEDLQRNRVAQPFIFAYQMNLWEQLATKLPRPVCAAGYSLGEMAACAAAGAFSISEGIQLCAERADAMDRCVDSPVGLMAIKGLSADVVSHMTQNHGLVLAITNGPDHFVLAGKAASLREAEAVALSMGANRAIQLGVTTPSHTHWLARATDDMTSRLKGLVPNRLLFPVFSAIDGRSSQDFERAMSALADQISTPLNWKACLEAVYEMRPDLVLEIGPGNALARMWDECGYEIPARATDDFKTIDGILGWVESKR